MRKKKKESPFYSIWYIYCAFVLDSIFIYWCAVNLILRRLINGHWNQAFAVWYRNRRDCANMRVPSQASSSSSVPWQQPYWEPLLQSAVKPFCHSLDWSVLLYWFVSTSPIFMGTKTYTQSNFIFTRHSMAIQWNQNKCSTIHSWTYFNWSINIIISSLLGLIFFSPSN